MSDNGTVRVEATGETVGEAKWAALRQLEQLVPGLDRESVEFQVVTEGERGLLGVGYTPAHVVATAAAGAGRSPESAATADAREFVERRLRKTEGAVIGFHDAAVDLHEQRFDFVGQVAHRDQAGHACTALERVQRTLQRDETVDAAAIFIPLGERALRLLDELDRFVGEIAGDLRIEIREHIFGHVRDRRGCGGRYRRKGSGGSRDRRRD